MQFQLRSPGMLDTPAIQRVAVEVRELEKQHRRTLTRRDLFRSVQSLSANKLRSSGRMVPLKSFPRNFGSISASALSTTCQSSLTPCSRRLAMIRTTSFWLWEGDNSELADSDRTSINLATARAFRDSVGKGTVKQNSTTDSSARSTGCAWS